MNKTTNITANKNLTSPMNEIAKETWADLLNIGFQAIPDEQLPNLLQIIGHDSAFKYRYSVGNEDSEDKGELCTVFDMPYAIYDGVIKLQIVKNKYDKNTYYLQLKNIDTEDHIIFSYPIKEIGDFVFMVEDDDDLIEIYFRYRNMTIYLELKDLDVEDDDTVY